MTDEELESKIWNDTQRDVYSALIVIPYGKNYRISFSEHRQYNKFVGRFPRVFHIIKDQLKRFHAAD